MPKTKKEIDHDRQAFWETIEHYGVRLRHLRMRTNKVYFSQIQGRQEVWQLLRQVAETSDYRTGRAMLRAAEVTLPHGELTQAYDRFGFLYQVPQYCLSYPMNLVAESSQAVSSQQSRLVSVRVRSSCGENVAIKVNDSEPVESLSKYIEVPPDKTAQFMYLGHHLEPRSPLNNYHIEDGAVIQAFLLDIL